MVSARWRSSARLAKASRRSGAGRRASWPSPTQEQPISRCECLLPSQPDDPCRVMKGSSAVEPCRFLAPLRPAHSHGHRIRDRYPRASDISSPPCLPRLLPAGAIAGRGSHRREKRRLVTAHVVSRHSRSVSPLTPLAGIGPSHIGGEDRGEAAGLAHGSSPAARRRPDTSSSRCSGFCNGRSSGTS